MSTNNETLPIRVGLIALPTDNPATLADLALTFLLKGGFKITVVVCNVRSFFGLPFGNPMIGMPTPPSMIRQCIKYDQNKTQILYRKVDKALDKLLLEDRKPEVIYISGHLRHIASVLESVLDFVVVPHRFKLPSVSKALFYNLDVGFIKTNKVATLFCSEMQEIESLIVVQVKGGIGCRTKQLLDQFSDSLKMPTYYCYSEKYSPFGNNASDTRNQLPSMVYQGISKLDISAIPLDKQTKTIIAVPTRVLSSIIKFRKLRQFLREWHGDLLFFSPRTLSG